MSYTSNTWTGKDAEDPSRVASWLNNIEGGLSQVANGGSISASTLVLNSVQRVVYDPGQATFTGTLVFGDGGQNLTHSAGGEGRYNTLVGQGTGSALTSGAYNTLVGAGVGTALNTAQFVTAMGQNAIPTATNPQHIVAIGVGAIAALTNGQRLVGVGDNTLSQQSTGADCVAVGNNACDMTTSSYVTAVGSSAGYSCSGNYNTFVGSGAGYGNGVLPGSSGTNNTAVGANAFSTYTSGSYNVADGVNALLSATTANYNVAVGYQAGYAPAGTTANATVAGHDNVFLGAQTGASDTSDPSNSVAIGSSARVKVNNIAIGSGVSATGAGTVAIGRDSTGTACTSSVDNQIALGTNNHHILLKSYYEPSDASFAASQFTFWLDATNGAAKLNIKAKQANGTVVKGSVNLA